MGKGAILLVAVEDIGAVVGHVKVAEAIVVVVAHGAAGPPASIADPGPGGGIDKAAVPAVGVEDIARSAFVLVGGKGGAIDYVEVQVAVVIVVEKGGPGAVCFEDVFLF